MKRLRQIGYILAFLIALIVSGCISPKIQFSGGVFEEKEISIPYVFNLSGGKKLKILEVEVKEADYVVSKEEKWSWSDEVTPVYHVYYPREGFTFYIAKIKIENVGGKILNVYTDLPESFELMTNNNTYDALSYDLLTEEKGFTHIESNDTKYENELCEYFSENIYPGEIEEGSVFFEIRENEQPVRLSFAIGLALYHVEIQPMNFSYPGLEYVSGII